MTSTFDNINDVIIFALEKIIFNARQSQQIVVAQCVWWLPLVIGLEEGLINYIDNLRSRVKIAVSSVVPPEEVAPTSSGSSQGSRDKVLQDCMKFLRDSKRLWEITLSKRTGKSRTGRKNLTKVTKEVLRKPKDHSKTEGIDSNEIKQRKSAGECLCCAWPSDRKGTHRREDCIRPIKLDKGTASYPKGKVYLRQQSSDIQDDSSSSSKVAEGI
jgi:hypothetical protein